MKRFAIIGVAGYVAPRHLAAIADVGGELIAAHDIAENVGILDRYFPQAAFFTDPQQFHDFLVEQKPDYLTICTPNDMHAQHIMSALELGIHVICEKPLVIDPSLIPAISAKATAKGLTVNTILQLRKLPSIVALKERIDREWREGTRYDVRLEYISARGDWYFKTWKGRKERSGGLIFNIGIHLFDLLLWLFGPLRSYALTESGQQLARGGLTLQKANVHWTLSVDPSQIPQGHGKSIFRVLELDGERISFDEGTEDLHTACYKDILYGEGLGIAEVTPSTELCFHLSN